MIDHEALEMFVPHKGKMFLLHSVVDRCPETSSGEPWLVSKVEIGATSMFFDHHRQGVPVWLAFEYMAQSIAALSGIAAHETTGAEPQIGFILGVRDFVCSCGIFPLGSQLLIRVNQIFRDGPVVSFQCSVTQAGQTLVTAIINAIEVDEQAIQSMIGAKNV